MPDIADPPSAHLRTVPTRAGRQPGRVRSLLSLIVPPLCPLCRGACGASEPVCARCREQLTASRGGLIAIEGADWAWAATTYEGTGRALVGQLKFAGRLALAAEAARAIVRIAPIPSPGAEVVAVPPDPVRSRLRGFDPATLIAGELARRYKRPLAECLARSHSPRQVGRSRAARIAQGPAVRLVREPPVQAILVDDVITTGTTLAASAAALREGGCAEILALAFARA